MDHIAGFTQNIFSDLPGSFDNKAFAAFHLQAENNPVYQKFLHYLDIRPGEINKLNDIPFLPVELFKTNRIITGDHMPSFYFESSGTTSENKSRHYIADIALYERSILSCFNLFYGSPGKYCFLFLLPAYLERKHASLVYMADVLMRESNDAGNGFYLDDLNALHNQLKKNEAEKINTMLFGVSFGLLDFAEQYPMALSHTTIIETGGMKGRREEITRQSLHGILSEAFKTATIHSEYGMTELLSQAYSSGNGIFFTPPWMRILIRDPQDPFNILEPGKTGCINVIDLANIYSCSFIATQDLGRINQDGSFEVLGRYDNSDIRGCNLMVE